jgi:hypothetical protein
MPPAPETGRAAKGLILRCVLGAYDRGGDAGCVHGIAFDPIEIEMVELAGRLLGPPMKRANAKATPGKRKSGLGAHATRRTDQQHDVIFCHETLAYLSKSFASLRTAPGFWWTGYGRAGWRAARRASIPGSRMSRQAMRFAAGIPTTPGNGPSSGRAILPS